MQISSLLEFGSHPPTLRAGAGVCIADPITASDVFAAFSQLDIEPILVGQASIDVDYLKRFETIVTDARLAPTILSNFAIWERDGGGISPSVIAVHRPTADLDTRIEYAVDGALHFPMRTDEIADQLRIILFAHRAFVKRYQETWQELSLNRRIFRSITTGITLASATVPDLPLVYVNPAFESMTGYSREEVEGRNCRFLEGTERDQPALASIRDALVNRRRGTAVLKNFRKDGTPFWNELSLSPISDDDGRLTHFVGIQTDVTIRVELERALRESEKLAAVGRLSSSIAHEINNPLASVMNLIYIAERTDCSQETRDYLMSADRELRRVKFVTEQALRFSRQSTEPQSTMPQELIDPILDLYQTQARNAGVVIAARERLTLPVTGMESELRQVLNNLINNSIHSMQGKGGRLNVRWRNATDYRSGTKGVLFTVADTGCGMTEDTLKHIYEAFFTTKGIGGSGLGLWISCEIVARHHGSLKDRSSQCADHQGTVIQMFIPLHGISLQREKVMPPTPVGHANLNLA